ncbi:MAG: polysaccharide biosynthesis protein [Idiomarinaceae bacterium]|nr:polysaccharide biosynthesis protein [Idiomarinaceae bacterium]
MKLSKYIVTTLLGMGLVANVSAQQIKESVRYQPTQSDLGGTGFLQMPSARMNKEGEFSAGYYDNDDYRRMYLSIQLFPWLEATLRYNDVRTRFYSPVESFSGDQTYKDRAIDVKLRLLEESQYLPEISVGLRDVGGTGRFSGEFIAANKRFGPFDVMLGLGFGYLGERGTFSNPFCEAAERFCERDLGFEEGGEFNTDNWFAGEDASLFGGIEYQTPWAPLKLIAEFDGNDYKNDFSARRIIQESPWNYGAHYRVTDNFNVQLSYERGNTWMFGFNLRMNMHEASMLKKDRPKEQPQEPKVTNIDEAKARALAGKIFYASGFGVNEVHYDPNTQVVTLTGFQSNYLDHTMSIERAARLLANELPQSVKAYRFVDEVREMELAEVQVDAQTFKRAFYRADITTRYEDSYRLTDVSPRDGQTLWQRSDGIRWPYFGVRPYLEQSFGSPENFYMYQLRLDAEMGWKLSDKLRLDGIVSGSLMTNYDEFNYLQEAGPAPIPRVRTYVREYVTQSDIWLQNLQATYVEQLHKDWYASLYGGYLERMFGGVGSEVLYRPFNAGWAVGLDVNYAKQRSFETHLGFRDYDVITGHLTGYWEPEFFDDVMVKVAAGQFLAKDKGVQVQFEKKFDSGIIVGAYAAKTDVSAEDFGEGSFTKGFYMSIPFDLFQMTSSGRRANVGWTPLTRDGGQMLGRSNRLFGITDARSRYYTEWD